VRIEKDCQTALTRLIVHCYHTDLTLLVLLFHSFRSVLHSSAFLELSFISTSIRSVTSSPHHFSAFFNPLKFQEELVQHATRARKSSYKGVLMANLQLPAGVCVCVCVCMCVCVCVCV
jgi:hypothetical protein